MIKTIEIYKLGFFFFFLKSGFFLHPSLVWLQKSPTTDKKIILTHQFFKNKFTRVKDIPNTSN